MPSSAMRTSPRRVVKTLFMVSMFGFILINMNLLLENSRQSPDNVQNPDPQKIVFKKDMNSGLQNRPPDKDSKQDNAENVEPNNVNKKDVLLPQSANNLHKDQVDISKMLSHIVHRTRNEHESDNDTAAGDVFNSDSYTPVGHDLAAMKAYIAQANKGQRIRNLDTFDLPTSQNSAVIVIQVHNRTDYLRILLDSFRRSRHIENALLIFSHDYFSDDVNKMIHDIDFCLTMQIFYPIPIQLYPHEFPGEDPGDCPRDSNREQAARLNCINSQWPDKYGHYREAKYTQTKHHWYWKANHVFDHLKVMKNFNGPVLFVEEDHMMTDDFIHVLQKMYRYKDTACKDCSILTLGTYLKQPVYGSYSKKVDIMNWVSSKHNMGMAFDRNTWQSIKACAEPFCRFDDYNWDWSLQYVSMSCMQNRLRVMLMKSPRIYHIGECGVHHKGKNCDPAGRVAAIQKLLTDNQQFLFPDQLEVAGYPRTPTKMPKPNGGWGDRRDHELCIRFTQPDLHR